MALNLTPTLFENLAPPWSLVSLDGNFSAIAAGLALPETYANYQADTGAVNAYVVTPSPAWAGYANGRFVTFIPNNTNTGASTINVSGLGVKNIVNGDSSSLVSGQLIVGIPYILHYSTVAGAFILIGSPSATAANIGNIAGRNRIINGDFRIDQRNLGAAQTVNNTSAYTIDRWFTNCTLGVGTGAVTVQRVNNAATAMGNPYAASFSVSTAKGALAAGDVGNFLQRIEGLNVQDLLWGTASAKPIVVSFTFQTNIANAVLPIAIHNGAANRSYLTSITTGTANTPARYSVTVPGDTTGTWAIDNTLGIELNFGFAMGSTYQGVAGWQAGNFITLAGATNFMGNVANTWQITDVQLESNNQTAMERLGYDQQLARCKRYLPAWNSSSVTSPICVGAYLSGGTAIDVILQFGVPTRVPPTGITSSAASTYSTHSNSGTQNATAGPTLTAASTDSAYLNLTINGSAGAAATVYFNSASGQLLFTGCEL